MHTNTCKKFITMNPPLQLQDHHKTTVSSSSTWFSQNVYPLLTPKRVIYFTLSQISFFLAYGFFTQTERYRSCIISDDGEVQDQHSSSSVFDKARPLIFLVAAFGIHTISLIFLMFFCFCSVAFERCRYHYIILKSIGEYLVMLLVPFLIMEIGGHRSLVEGEVTHDKVVEYSKVAGLVTCGLLTIEALWIVNLLEPSHHYALFEASSTLTLHLGLAERRMYLRIPAVLFVFVIVMIKNLLWSRHASHSQNPSNIQVHHVDSEVVAPEVV